MNLREWALPVYTILMQLAIGAFTALWIIRQFSAKHLSKEELDRLVRHPLSIIFLTVIAGMIGSHFHLSRPYLSFFAILNLRSSWLSREVLFTVLFMLTIGSLWLLQVTHRVKEKQVSALGWVGVLFGFVAVFCMSRIYLIPTQIVWNTPITIYTFYSTAVLLGALAMAAILVLDLKFLEIRGLEDLASHTKIVYQSLPWLALVAFVMAWIIIALNFLMIQSLRSQGGAALISLDLLLGLYQPLLIMRFVMLLAGVGWLVTTVVTNIRKMGSPRNLTMPVYMACLMVMIGEILGRYLFYATHIRLGI
jgi:anaerobic dimethyl sulfoxide reductase subunit C (anchor subunit)